MVSIDITYDEATRFIDFCNDEDGNISKDFFDWYINENGLFFIKKGILRIQNVLNKEGMITVSFDLTDVNKTIFTLYSEFDNSIICTWEFCRNDNIDMKDHKLKVIYYSATNLKKSSILYNEQLLQHEIEILQGIAQGKRQKGFRHSSTKDILKDALSKGVKDIAMIACKSSVNYVYALMYHSSKQEVKLINSETKSRNEEKSRYVIYNYSGYVNISDLKRYVPKIKIEDSETRVYGRHIEKWSVRGHYRKTKNGLIWIDSHTKGVGEIEQRHYSTLPESELNLINKQFLVERHISKPKQDVKDNTFENMICSVLHKMLPTPNHFNN